MKKLRFLGLLATVIVLAFGFTLAACDSGSSEPTYDDLVIRG